MSKTKLPRECTTTASPSRSKPCTQCGWPPMIRSAPASAKARAAVRWLGSGRWVYWVPQWVSTTTVSTRRSSAAMSALIRRSWARFSVPVRGGMFNRWVPGRDRRRGGVSPIESTARKPTRTPSRSTTTGRRASSRVRPAPDDRKPGGGKAVQRLPERPDAEVADVVVGQRDHIEPGTAQAREHVRTRRRRSHRLASVGPRGQGGLEVPHGDLRRGQACRHGHERSARVAAMPGADPAAEHDVADGAQCGHLGHRAVRVRLDRIALRVSQRVPPPTVSTRTIGSTASARSTPSTLQLLRTALSTSAGVRPSSRPPASRRRPGR